MSVFVVMKRLNYPTHLLDRLANYLTEQSRYVKMCAVNNLDVLVLDSVFALKTLTPDVTQLHGVIVLSSFIATRSLVMTYYITFVFVLRHFFCSYAVIVSWLY